MIKANLELLKQLREEATPESVVGTIESLGDYFSIPVLEEVLKHYKRLDQEIISKALLEDLTDMDIDSFENEEVKAKIKMSVNASMKDKLLGADWLESHGYGDIIKSTLSFGKGELTPDILKVLDEKGLSYSLDSKVHPASLKKVISDRIKDGEELPPEGVINVSTFDYVEVKRK